MKDKPIKLPAPEMLLLTPHDDFSLAHLIERHIRFFRIKKDENGAEVEINVAPPMDLVRHYAHYRESKLPVVTAIVTAPLVLPDGTLLARDGLDRTRGILFALEPKLLAILPKPEECTPEAVAEAMRFLTNDWLCDVNADLAGKCILIASALTILERVLLPERPAFFVTAGQRGGGKTTTLQMIFVAATGHRVPAAAWSPSEEERRKSLFSYLSEGVAAVCWDNIPRGTAISCPSIEKSLTSLTYTDRVLGKSETRTAPATTITFFTGNNITPRGDLASRSLQVRLMVDRPDPENRLFKHADPIAWTVAHRGNILKALYTILLGNPRLQDRNPAPAETRFKMWWHLIGSAVEHAAKVHEEGAGDLAHGFLDEVKLISFKNLFQTGEADDEQTGSLASILDFLQTNWPKGFVAKDVSDYARSQNDDATAFVKAIESASGKPILGTPSARVITWSLKTLIDAPVQVGETVVALRYAPSNRAGKFSVEEVKG